MIHTATFICPFEIEELNHLSNLYSMDIYTLLYEIDNTYNGITSRIIKKYNYTLYITVDFIKLLGSPNINDYHYPICEKILNDYLSRLNISINDLTLIRLDYRMDFLIANNFERRVLFNCFSKALDTYRLRIKNCAFNSSIYFSNKSIQTIVYDKEKERIDNNCVIQDYEKNVLRFEVRLLNKHLNSNKTKYKIEKTLKNYFSITKQKEYFQKYILPVFFDGDFYSFFKAKEIIADSHLKERDKNFLINFLDTVTYKGLTYCKTTLSQYKYSKALKLLNELNINPLTITIKNIIKLKNPFSSNILNWYMNIAAKF